MPNRISANIPVDLKDVKQSIEKVSIAVIKLQEAINEYNLAIQSLPIELKTKTSYQNTIL